MSCDDYYTCPKCKKFESLKVWYNDFFNDTCSTISLDEIEGNCNNCNYTFKGIKVKI